MQLARVMDEIEAGVNHLGKALDLARDVSGQEFPAADLRMRLIETIARVQQMLEPLYEELDGVVSAHLPF